METVKLTHFNSSFRIEGNNKRRSLEIKTIRLVERLAPANLKLLVLDEKDIPIFSQEILTAEQNQHTTVSLNKKFAFYEHLSVCVKVQQIRYIFTC
ncbi:hypothetical protein MKJ04_14335 [Pontibacter sp. E15-1]|uniref:hypothetical protein n=1 Tax=Pontibacter sp. E15-1 TaxID=2919918 RepID=UPI001F4F7BF2|nr:hypothetical protein [Pontibacter sp. E15-1]MCJ8166021.1 hypothetical protein [Pontibacter sp. E15-1]